MPQYKKRHINRLRGAAETVRNKKARGARISEPQDIEMTPSGKSRRTSKPHSDMRVVKGKKLERRRRAKVLTAAAAVIAVVCVVLQLILPVGIIENIQNLTALIGSGGYPISLESSNTLNTVSRGTSHYYVLTDTRINAFSGGGKEIYSYAHGFENPVLKTSETRAMVFDQGGSELFIYNLASLKGNLKTESEIITANISDSGTYAVVTQSESYASAVSVYDKNNRLVYEWYSSEDTVNNVAVSPNGKKIAVSAFSAASGNYKSKVSVLNFSSATPEFTEEYDGTLVLNLDTAHSSGFSVVTSGGVDFINWSDYEKAVYENEYPISMFRSGSGGSAAVFSRESDRTDNRIAVFSSKGKLKSEFEFKGIISDIQISGGHIYCISGTKIYLLDSDGAVLRSAECGFGAVRLAVTGSNLTAVITDNRIDKIKLELIE